MDPCQTASGPALRPPRLPIARASDKTALPPKLPAAPSPGSAMQKRRPPALQLCKKEPEQDFPGEAQNFDMSTPRGTGETSRHYIGTPKASAILSAFMDFDDVPSDTEGPPLDFDDAMMALEERNKAKSAPGSGGDEGSTECSSSQKVESSDDDSEFSDGDEREEHYESDFETDSESCDEESDEDEATPADSNAQVAPPPNLPPSGRLRAASRGACSRAGSRSRAARERSQSRARGARASSRGSVTRLRSLERVLTTILN